MISQDNSKYPQVFCPRNLDTVFEDLPTLPNPKLSPILISPDLPPKPTPPEEFDEPPPKAVNYTLLGVLSFIIVILSGMAFTQSAATGLITFGVLALLSGGVTLFRLRNYPERLKQYKKQRRLYEQKVNQYPQLLGEWEKEKQRIFENHQKEKERRKQHNELVKQEHQQKLSELRRPENIQQWRIEQFNRRVKQLMPTQLEEKIDVNEFDPRGYAETNGSLPRLLRHYFGNKIYILHRISGTYGRIPDFAYIDPSYPLNIDIEIDEPYTPRQYPNSDRQLKITHSISNSHYDKRLNEILNSDWFAIHFSERQALTEPQACCKAVAALIDLATVSNLVEQHFREVPDLTPDPCWTSEEAEKMAKRRERLNYY